MNLWKPLDPKVSEILNKAQDMAGISQEEAVYLLRLDLCSRETYAVMALANRMSRQSFGSKGERHFHIGLNVEGCSYKLQVLLAHQRGGHLPGQPGVQPGAAPGLGQGGAGPGGDALNLMTTAATL